MRKAFIIIIAFMLLLSISGCESVPPASEELSFIDVINASNIADAVNAGNHIRLNGRRLISGDTTLEEAKHIIKYYFWPSDLSSEEGIAALKLISIKDGVAKLKSETQDTLSGVDAVYANNIVIAINAYNTLHPYCQIGCGMTLWDAIKIDFWPKGLSDEEERVAWKLIVIKDGVASLILEAQDELQIAAKHAGMIATAVNAHKALCPCCPFDNDITLEGVKEEIGQYDEMTGDLLWPAGISDEEARAAWKLIVYEDYIAILTPGARETLKGEIRYESDRVRIADASAIAQGINVYNALHPDTGPLPDDITLAEVKETLEEEGLWPEGLSDEEERAAWELIEIKDGKATVKREG